MKKLALSFSFIIIALLFPSFMSAHMSRDESLMHGQMHIDPDDDPIAGLDAKLNFRLEDRTGKFNPKNCDCIVNIFKDDLLIFSQPIFPSEKAISDIAENFSIVYLFPGRGQYFIHFIGEPKSPNDFEAFRLEFDVQIDRGELIPSPTFSPALTPFPEVTQLPPSSPKSINSTGVPVLKGIFFGCLLVLLIYFLIWRKK